MSSDCFFSLPLSFTEDSIIDFRCGSTLPQNISLSQESPFQVSGMSPVQGKYLIVSRSLSIIFGEVLSPTSTPNSINVSTSLLYVWRASTTPPNTLIIYIVSPHVFNKIFYCISLYFLCILQKFRS